MTDNKLPEEGTPEEELYRDKTQRVGIVPLPNVVSSERTAAFVVIGGRAFGQSFNVERDETLIGRAPDCDIVLDDDGISRHHARVISAEGRWVLLDLDSTNGTYHDGERIQVLTLEDGDKIQLGLGTILRFQYQDDMDERYHRSMYESKTRDPLTGAYNRGYFTEAIEREVAYASRHGTELALIMFDLDRFKAVNDEHGHRAGDMVLQAVAHAVHDTIRREDVLARYGGEEFVVLTRGLAAETAFVLAERIRRSVERIEVVHKGTRIPCTVSVGIATLGGDLRTPSELIDAADERMIEAKKKGRNRTEAPIFD